MTEDGSPPPITRGILKLARQILASSTPAHVAVDPAETCRAAACFENVPAVVKRAGGTIQYGWRMREQPSVFVEGEFHAVWRRPCGQLVDVTPRTDGLTTIIFLPDDRTTWDGDPIEPRRLMLHEQPCYCGSRMPFNLCHALVED